MANYDVIGNIILVKFPESTKANVKKNFGKELLSLHKGARTVLEKTDRFKGRLRTLKTNWIAGEKSKEVLYRENGCEFRFNVDSCYFSPRLSTDRMEISEMVRKRERVLVMFGGVAPYAIVMSKKSKAAEIFSVELSRECNKYALENVKRNKAKNVKIIQGDVRRVIPKITGKFDRVVMTRPNLEDSFLDVAFKVVKKNGFIHYHGFYRVNEVEEENLLNDLIDFEARKAKKKVKIVGIKRAGDIAPYKYRYRADLKILN